MTRLPRLVLAMVLMAVPHLALAQIWTSAGSLAAARAYHTSTRLLDGRVLVAGGSGIGGAGLSSAEVYDPATQAWAPAGSMARARSFFAAALLPDGRVLVTGGRGGPDGGFSTNTAEIYDPGTGAWTQAPGMNHDRTGHTATVLNDGRVLVVGGYSDSGGGFLAAAELYDPTVNSWTPAMALATGRWQHTATLLHDGRVLIVAGENYAFCNASCGLASAEIYDPTTGLWSGTGSLGASRMAHGAVVLPDGRVLVAGGLNYNNGSVLPATTAGAELFDPGTGAWSPTGSLLGSRESFALARLPDGKVLVAGGRSYTPGSTILSTAEQYDPATGVWVSVASLNATRFSSGATLLTDGTVLVAGGSDGSQAIAGAERFGPAAPPPNSPPAVQIFGGGFVQNESQFQNFFANGNFTDQDSETWSATVDFGDGTGVQGLPLSNIQPGSGPFPTGQFSLGHTYVDNGIYTVTVTIDDGEGGVSSATAQATITNQAPQVFASGGGSVNAGAVFSSCVSFFDPGADTPWTAVVDFGDGTPLETIADAAMQQPGSCGFGSTTGAFTVSHVYSTATFGQNPSFHTGTVTVTDKDGGVGTGSFSITVRRANPTIALASSGSPSNVGQNVTFTATVTGQPGVVPPTGTVTFSVNGNVVGSQPLDANGHAVFSTSTLPAGSPLIRAQFNQDANYFSASQTITQVVTLALVSIRVAPASSEVLVGEGRQFTAFGTFSDGSEKVLPNAGGGGGGGGNAPSGATWQVHFAGSGLSINDCVPNPGPGGFSSQSFFTDNGQVGTVHTTWSPSTPVVNVDGTVTLAQVNLVLTCSSTAAPAGSIVANWTGARYEGSATLSGVTVPVSIVGWSEKASMPTARFSSGAASLSGLVLVMGGAENGAPSSTVAAYDPASDSWTSRQPMPTSHEGPGVAALNGRIYVVGGNAPGGNASSAVERYDPGTDTWESLAPIPTPRAHFVLVAAGNVLFAIGGDGGGASPAPIASVERYDPATNSWLALAPMPTARRFLAAGALNGGALIVAAGGSVAGNGPTSATEIYDVAANTWTTASPMPTADAAMTGAVAQNALFVFGGSSSRQLAYMYRLVSGQQPAGWAAMASMPVGRNEAAAAAVGDVIYVAGGLVGSNPSAPSTAFEAFHTPPPYDLQVNQGGGGGGGGGLPSPTWSVSSPAVASINGGGFANGSAPGQTMVVATANGISCVPTNTCGTLTVVAPAHVTFALAPDSVVFPAVTLTVTDPATGNTEGPFDVPIGVTQEIEGGLYQVHFLPPAGYTVSPDQAELDVHPGDSLTVVLRFAPIDTTPPLLTVPANQSAEATSAAGAVVTFPPALATDEGSGVASVTCDHASGETFPFGTTVVSCTAADNNGNIATASFTVTVLNAPPVATSDVATTRKGDAVVVTVLANDTDGNGDALVVTGATVPGHGTAEVLVNGAIRYTPVKRFVGTDSFSYTIIDTRGGSSTATVTVTVARHFRGDDCDHEHHRGGHRDRDDCDHDRDVRDDEDRNGRDDHNGGGGSRDRGDRDGRDDRGGRQDH